MRSKKNRARKRWKPIANLDAKSWQKKKAVAATAVVLKTLLDEKERQQLSLADLEAKTGIGRSNLSRLWNQSEPGVTLETVERIAAALNLRLTLIPQK